MAAGMVAADEEMLWVMLFSSAVYGFLPSAPHTAKPRMAAVTVALSASPVLSPT